MNRRRPKAGEIYRHFRGKKYRVLHIALCAETNEEMVVYEALQGGRVYVSALGAFLRETNKIKYPDAEQEYRCELCERELSAEHREKKEESEESLIMEFLENYKTAYCLKRLNYIRDIFADDAVIIVGNIVKRNLVRQPEERAISLEGQDIIKYNRYDKETYLKNLARTFKLNEFINIRFTHTDVQWLEKYEDEELYGIQIGQEYTSSRYADKGYLFLLVDMTDHDAPQIKVRTWQPNETSMSKIFSAGDFYND